MNVAAGKRTILRIALVVATVGLAIAGTWRYRSDRSSRGGEDPQAIGLHVDPECLDFGEAWEDSHFSWVLPIENRSSSDIAIERFYNSCVCTEITPSSLLVPPGQTRDVLLTINLRDDRKLEAKYDFEVGVAAIVAGDGGQASQEWVVRGRVRRAVEFDPLVVDFGRHSEREQPLPPKRVRVKDLAGVESLAVNGSPDGFTVQVNRPAEDPSRFDIEIVPKAALPVGRCTFDLSIAPVQAGGKRLPARKLPVCGWVVPDLEASPSEVLLGAVAVGESAEATIAIRSLTGQAFTVEGWRCSSDRVSVVREGMGAGGPMFRVRWVCVKSAGQQQEEALFRIAAGGKAETVVAVPVKCIGVGNVDGKEP
jgi:hypothetical protein